MEIFAPYQELNSYVKDRFGKPVSVSCSNDNDIRVTYTQRILIKDVNINVDLHVQEVKDDSITLTYKGAMGLDMLISGALSFFKSYFPELSAGIHPEENRTIRINLSEIEKAKVAVENIALKYICAEPHALKIGFDMKIPQPAVAEAPSAPDTATPPAEAK